MGEIMLTEQNYDGNKRDCLAVRFVIIVFICRIEFLSYDGARNESNLKNMI